MKKRICSMVLALVLLMGLSGGALASSEESIDALISGSAAYLYDAVPAPQVGSIGGEWAVLGLARSGYNVPQSYYDDYYTRVENYVKSAFDAYGEAGLNVKNYTEYSRLIVGLAAIGKDARNVKGCDLTTFLGDFDKTIWQGNNGAIWALIALDAAAYPTPINSDAANQASRQMYIDEILRVQMSDGGWVLDNAVYSVSDPDMTGMALQALAKYTDQPKVAAAVQKGLNCVNNMIQKRGLLSYSSTTSESISQILVALCELGEDYRQAKYTKDGTNLLEALIRFRQQDGSFIHSADGSGDNLMSAEQGLYTLVAVRRFLSGENSLYRMTDEMDLGGDSAPVVTTNGNGDIAVTSLADGRVQVLLSFNDRTITLTSAVAFQNGTNEFTIQSTNDLACVVLSEGAGTYTMKTISSNAGKHTVSVSSLEKLVVSFKGNVNGDGNVNSADAMKIARSCLSKTNPAYQALTEKEKALSDINGDGKINSADAMAIARTCLSKSNPAYSLLSW